MEGSDAKDDVDEEIEVLRAIYENINVTTQGSVRHVCVYTDNLSSKSKYQGKFQLIFVLGKDYPKEAPSFKIVGDFSFKSVKRKYKRNVHDELVKHVEREAKRKVGDHIIFDLVQEAMDFLNEENHPFQDVEEQEDDKPDAIPPFSIPFFKGDTLTIASSDNSKKTIVEASDGAINELLFTLVNDAWPRVTLVRKKYQTIPVQLLGTIHPCIPILRELNLSNNEIVLVSPKISNLALLTKLYLNNNQIRHLPQEICKLKELKVLSIAENQIAVLPEDIGALEKLEVLDLEKNKIQQIPASVSSLSRLSALILSYNRLRLIPPEIFQLDNLSRFTIYSNPIIYPPSDVYIRGRKAIKEFLKDSIGGFSYGAETLSEDMSKAVNQPEWSDISFLIEEKIVYAHKCIIAQRCPKLVELFDAADQVTIPDIKHETFLEFLRYIYSGKCKMSTELIEAFQHFGISPSSDPSEYKQFLADLMTSQTFSDVHFRVEGKIISAHRVVFARSDYFKAMFNFGDRKETFTLTVSTDVFNAIVEFLYTDDIEKSLEIEDLIVDLAITACQFSIDRLITICQSIIGYNIDADNVASLYALAKQHMLTKLENCCSYFIITHFKQVKRTSGWRNLNPSWRVSLMTEVNKINAHT